MSQTNQQIPQLVKRPRMQVNPPVFFISAVLILAFVLFTAIFPKVAGNFFDMLQAGIVRDFGWFYILSVAIFLMFVIFLMLSRYGDVKLGPDDSEPELPRHGALVRQRPAA
jgi:choline/glycine/proline betaine transport protein